MTWRWNLTLAILGVALSVAISRFQAFPGYLDSDYYMAGGIQIASGRGFSEPYLWNYLDEPTTIPHPSHSYWMPMASIIASVGMRLTGQTTYETGRLGFILLAGLVPVVTARLAYTLTRRRSLALLSGLLAVFSGYYAPFLPVPDNYAFYMLLGAFFLLMAPRRDSLVFLALGVVSGGMTLARSDGLLWLLAAVAVPLMMERGQPRSAASIPASKSPWSRLRVTFGPSMLAMLGFLVIMGPWFARNLQTHHALLAPGGERLLWLTQYNDTFIFPATELTSARWLQQGWQAIASARLAALRWNLLNAFAAQGSIFLAPFVLIGAWLYRRDMRVRIGVLVWFSILAMMTLVFPFAGARGGFFHAGASLQPLWWALAPAGLDFVIGAARRRGMFTEQAFTVFGTALVAIAVLMTGLIIWLRVLRGWGEGEDTYLRVEAVLRRAGMASDAVVMVRNPPGYYLLTGHPAIVVPFSAPQRVLEAARQFGASYLIIEPAGAAGPIKTIYDLNAGDEFELVGELDETRIFRIKPED